MGVGLWVDGLDFLLGNEAGIFFIELIFLWLLTCCVSVVRVSLRLRVFAFISFSLSVCICVHLWLNYLLFRLRLLKQGGDDYVLDVLGVGDAVLVYVGENHFADGDV